MILFASRLAFVLAAISIVAACAPVSKLPDIDPTLHKVEELKQRQLVVESKRDTIARLHRLSYPILKANADTCGKKVGKSLGIYTVSVRDFGEDNAQAAEGVGIRKRPTVISVAAGSAAEQAGIRVDDILLQIGGTELPDNDDDGPMREALDSAAKSGEMVSLRLARATKEHKIDVPFDIVCDYSFRVQEDDAINAFADGKRLIFTTGILRFAAKDEELAIIIGHELAHNVMGHLDKKQGNAAIGLVFDLLFAGVGVNTQGAFSNMAGSVYSQEFEAEADYVGLYFVKRANMPIKNAPHFWRCMAVEHPGGIKDTLSSSHPATPKRFVALEETVKEIEAKVADGRPLKPELGFQPPGGEETEKAPGSAAGN